MKKWLLFVFIGGKVCAQGYTSYFTGNSTNVTTVPLAGYCLMGGATENDNAMTWLLQRANGGDVVVLRSSGSDGYNDYFYSDLGVNVNSVETLVITSVAGATNPYVLNKVAQAELIWIAGGDQFNYVSFFKDNALETLLNAHINEKNAPIGGTSAGMAILGAHYFSAQNGSVTSAQATSNPFHPNVTIGSNDFLQIPILTNTITDTHFDNPDRRGRLAAFLARLVSENQERKFGIASNEYVSVCIDENGIARVFGDFPNYEEYAFFVQPNCTEEFVPEICTANNALTWNRNGEALKVYRVPGTQNGIHTFNLNDWNSGSGGNWFNWRVVNGSIAVTSAVNPQCFLAQPEVIADGEIGVAPNPVHDWLHFDRLVSAVSIFGLDGKCLFDSKNAVVQSVDFSGMPAGYYVLSFEFEGVRYYRKILRN
ncbi:Type 1 glutamine amidotransferase-like domain-containing protein [Flavobacterium sp.]|uniref:Type 1 glutamine amidotransferase-like domain-containing protein n=1 Tax=Flavobacterium sp. TaxID=239 RepID=UPI003B9CDA00